jgi:hypothetical protein
MMQKRSLVHEPRTLEFQKEYGSKGLQVVAVSMYGEGPDILKPFVAQYGMEQLRTVIGNEHTMTHSASWHFQPLLSWIERDDTTQDTKG